MQAAPPPLGEPMPGGGSGGGGGGGARASASSAGSSLRPRIDTSMYATSDEPAGASSGAAAVGPARPVYDVAPGPQLPTAADYEAQRFAAAADMAGIDSSQVISVSQDVLKRSMAGAFDAQKPPDEEQIKVQAKFYNRSTGEVTTTYQPNKLQKRKHQINSLAAEAAARSVELAQRRGTHTKTKAETAAKYGW
eukprot:Transcript_8666.p3 GENE.Transcript_8666~~Transcript_8666.p3  ORF type:complete len:193 (-),score=77.96 Transcript_8666:189-767(-)